ncbi:MAG: class I SAM-dependent methyltransferase [Methanomicrobiales archaeon]|nr:class I SAM-dependent methyltransferase [Methanomicrobiales archaeon]
MVDVNAIDWNEAWKKPDKEEGKKAGFISCGRRWNDPARCRRFSDAMKEDDWAGSMSRIHSMDIHPHSRVLDVGAGPGSLAIPLAKTVAHVTAVEPSKGMVTCLRENIAEAGIFNITFVPKKWEDVDINSDLDTPYDIVVASYSLGFPDLQDGLKKMNEASSKYVYIFWFADMRSPWQRNYSEIWEELYGVPVPTGKKPNIVFNLLNQMGIFANIEVTKEESVHKYATFDDAVADQKEGLNLKTEKQEQVLRKYLEKKLKREDGKFVHREISHRAKIWWEKEKIHEI